MRGSSRRRPRPQARALRLALWAARAQTSYTNARAQPLAVRRLQAEPAFALLARAAAGSHRGIATTRHAPAAAAVGRARKRRSRDPLRVRIRSAAAGLERRLVLFSS